MVLRRLISLLAVALFAACLAVGCADESEGENSKTVPRSNRPAAGEDGAPCTSDRECDGQACISEVAGWNDGYCTSLDCTPESCNGPDAVCREFLDGSTFCFDGCETDEDCRDGYRCRGDAGEAPVCMPPAQDGPPRGEIGGACDEDDVCGVDQVCLSDAPDGYCATASCDACPDGSVCGQWPAGGEYCLHACAETVDCRVGYRCMDGACIPADENPPEVPFDTSRNLLGVRCDPEEVEETPNGVVYRFDFSIGEDASSFMVVPVVEEGRLLPRALETPTGRVDLEDDYRHHNARLTELQFYDFEPTGTYAAFAFDWPILVPYAPRFSDMVTPGGAYALEVLASESSPCFYVLDGRDGTLLDLNIYLVDAVGLEAASAPTDPDVIDVLDRVETLLGDVSIRIDDVRFFDASKEVEERYGIIRNQRDIKLLTATGRAPDDTLDGHLSVDVFLVNDIVVGGISGALLGASAGVPGPPGLHGNVGNGLVFRSVDIGADNAHVSYIMAHELGHYLGLRHTTEIVHGTDSPQEADLAETVGTTDPIEDTPECASVVELRSTCPDATNLMFPTAPAPDDEEEPSLSAGQGATLRANPTVKRAE